MIEIFFFCLIRHISNERMTDPQLHLLALCQRLTVEPTQERSDASSLRGGAADAVHHMFI